MCWVQSTLTCLSLVLALQRTAATTTLDNNPITRNLGTATSLDQCIDLVRRTYAEAVGAVRTGAANGNSQGNQCYAALRTPLPSLPSHDEVAFWSRDAGCTWQRSCGSSNRVGQVSGSFETLRECRVAGRMSYPNSAAVIWGVPYTNVSGECWATTDMDIGHCSSKDRHWLHCISNLMPVIGNDVWSAKLPVHPGCPPTSRVLLDGVFESSADCIRAVENLQPETPYFIASWHRPDGKCYASTDKYVDGCNGRMFDWVSAPVVASRHLRWDYPGEMNALDGVGVSDGPSSVQVKQGITINGASTLAQCRQHALEKYPTARSVSFFHKGSDEATCIVYNARGVTNPPKTGPMQYYENIQNDVGYMAAVSRGCSIGVSTFLGIYRTIEECLYIARNGDYDAVDYGAPGTPKEGWCYGRDGRGVQIERSCYGAYRYWLTSAIRNLDGSFPGCRDYANDLRINRPISNGQECRVAVMRRMPNAVGALYNEWEQSCFAKVQTATRGVRNSCRPEQFGDGMKLLPIITSVGMAKSTGTTECPHNAAAINGSGSGNCYGIMGVFHSLDECYRRVLSLVPTAQVATYDPVEKTCTGYSEAIFAHDGTKSCIIPRNFPFSSRPGCGRSDLLIAENLTPTKCVEKAFNLHRFKAEQFGVSYEVGHYDEQSKCYVSTVAGISQQCGTNSRYRLKLTSGILMDGVANSLGNGCSVGNLVTLFPKRTVEECMKAAVADNPAAVTVTLRVMADGFECAYSLEAGYSVCSRSYLVGDIPSSYYA